MLAMLDMTSSLRNTFTSRKRVSAGMVGSLNIAPSNMDIAPPWGQPVLANFVAHGAQAHAQHLSGARAIASRGVEGQIEQTFFHALQRHARTKPVLALRRSLSGRFQRQYTQLAGLEN